MQNKAGAPTRFAGGRAAGSPAQQIAEVIAEAAIEVLLDRLPDVRLSVPADTLTWRPSPLFRGLMALPVEFTPA
jgi:cytochrome P450